MTAGPSFYLIRHGLFKHRLMTMCAWRTCVLRSVRDCANCETACRKKRSLTALTCLPLT